MRKIKFRGKDKKTNQWEYGALISQEYEADGDTLIRNIRYELSIVDSDTVGQFTGATDKNDIEIYEGDVVKSNDGRYFTVTFDNFAFLLCGGGVSYHFDSRDTKKMSVVGNIYDKIS